MALSLSEALRTGRLNEFAEQAEASGVQPIDSAELDDLLSALIKAPQPVDQTSHSRAGDGSPGK